MNKFKGLSSNEVINSRKKYGSNALGKKEKNSIIKLIINSLGDPIIKILLIALAIKVVFLFENFDWYETIGIVIAIFIATLISSISEYGSESAFATLQKESAQIKVKTIRNGDSTKVIIDEIVVDDIVILEAGDKVPADGTIIDGEVYLDESHINGESESVVKKINDKIFRGSVVVNKKCLMRVINVGSNTIYGKISEELLEKTNDSPLKLRLRHLAGILSKIGYFGAFFVFISYLFSIIFVHNHFDMTLAKEIITDYPLMAHHLLYALTLSVTIIVVAVPEGLPMMITIVLSSNMRKLIKRKVLVRKMEGIETAGNINILFTDKTGTITTGKLNMIGFIDSDNNYYNSDTDIKKYNKYYNGVYKSLIINNECEVNDLGELTGGNNTDKAMFKFFAKNNIDIKIIEKSSFNSTDKYLKTVIHDKTREIYVKGAYEKILKHCKLYLSKDGTKKLIDQNKILEIVNYYSSKSYRVLACAYSDKLSFTDLDNLILIGFALIKDEIRPGAIEGFNLIKSANIQTVMITGDSKETAVAIGREMGLVKSTTDIVLTSDELAKYPDEALLEKLPNIKIIARALPSDKSRLVTISQNKNLVVGMTGDGVNDAPALKKADVGFAMGSGSEVAKEASDIVILDDNLMSIVEAVLFGRTIFKNIRKFIVFQITINIIAVAISIIGPFIDVSTPVTVMQMLWINMIMDTLAALAFSFEPPLKETMSEKPKTKNEPIINKYMYSSIALMSLISSIILIFILKSHLIQTIIRSNIDNKYLYTVFFAAFIFMGIFNALNARTERMKLFANIKENKVFIIIFIIIAIIQLYLIYFGGNLFRSYGLNLKEFLFVILVSSLVIPIDIFRKFLLRNKKINKY